ncbi:MAG: branched-chain amino acid transport system II carrier protein [Flavobacteriaceae bacterium]|nr:branched-chain amino acid transport system II carrier protein [Flavobacteriaceae bacterium]
MNRTKESFVFGFAIFASFFGAGNLILPPLLGFNAGPDWWLVAFGFVLSATIIPLLSLFAHARLQGTMLDFGNKVSPIFSLVFCLCVYIIAVALPVPRTAAVTHEMSVNPFFKTSSLLTSSIYFILVFLFAKNRGKVIQFIGKYLTPFIAMIVAAIIGVGIFVETPQMNPTIFKTPEVSGLLEGYQTYDALAGLLSGGFVIISMNLSNNYTYEDKKSIIARSGFIAMMGLFLIYVGLIYLGANFNTAFSTDISRTELLTGLALKTLGNTGSVFLSVLVSLACFTTAVAIVVGTGDFFKGLFKESNLAYVLTVIISCLIGIFMGQMDVSYIIDVALPALMFIYPLAIVLIVLNVLPEKYASQNVFRGVVLVTFLFSIPDFLLFLIPPDALVGIKAVLPLSQYSLGWVLPAIATFIIINIVQKK